MYYRARYYDPTIGTFISQDPISFSAGDPNLYRYVGNNPLNQVDPSGLKPDNNDGLMLQKAVLSNHSSKKTPVAVLLKREDRQDPRC